MERGMTDQIDAMVANRSRDPFADFRILAGSEQNPLGR